MARSETKEPLAGLTIGYRPSHDPAELMVNAEENRLEAPASYRETPALLIHAADYNSQRVVNRKIQAAPDASTAPGRRTSSTKGNRRAPEMIRGEAGRSRPLAPHEPLARTTHRPVGSEMGAPGGGRCSMIIAHVRGGIIGCNCSRRDPVDPGDRPGRASGPGNRRDLPARAEAQPRLVRRRDPGRQPAGGLVLRQRRAQVG